MIALATLCLAGALAVALGLLIVARANGWRRRRIGMLVRPWLVAILFILTIGLAGAGRSGLARAGSLEWTLFINWLAVSLLIHVLDPRRAAVANVARRWGARLAHAGVGIAIGGAILSSLFTATSARSMAPGDTMTFAGWTIRLHAVWPAAGPGWSGIAAEVRASGGDGVILIEPALRTIDGTQQPVAATVSSGHGLLGAGVGPRDGDGKWPISLSWTPLLVLIPIGAMVSALGIAVAMVGPAILRWRRLRRARLATAWWA